MSTNEEIAKILSEFSKILSLKGDDRFKIAAYEKAAQMISELGESLEEIYQNRGLSGLDEIEGVGSSIAEKIAEYIEKGKVKELEKLKKSVPKIEMNLLEVRGIGPKTAKLLSSKLKAVSLEQVEKKLARGEGSFLGEKNCLRIVNALKSYRGLGQRMLISQAKQKAEVLISYLEKTKLAKKTMAVGSLRRGKETIGDIDLIAVSHDPASLLDHFAKFPDFAKLINKGDTKSSALYKNGIQVDLEILDEDKYGSLLQHFTGSKEHNIALRVYAQSKGLSLSEHGIKSRRSGRQVLIKCPEEEDVYKKIGLEFIPPELRENCGEIEAAIKRKLPELVKISDLRGDLHVHSSHSDSSASIEEIVKEAVRFGYEYVAICDHTESLKVAKGLDYRGFAMRQKEIERLRKKYPKIRILSSCEANILADGSLDIDEKTAALFDLVTASIHTGLNQPPEKITQRLIKAISNKLTDIIGHPTGRILNARAPYEADWSQIFKLARQMNVALEINSLPERLDLSDSLILEAKKFSNYFAISSDSHSLHQMGNLDYGIMTARRGWCESKDIINSSPYRDLLKWLEKKRKTS